MKTLLVKYKALLVTSRKLLVNSLAFELGWFACVAGAAGGQPMLGLLMAICIVSLHLVSVPEPSREFRLVVLAVAMGLVFDSLLVSAGWLRYPNGMILPGLAPYWILAMWALFATTLNVSLRWLKGRPLVAAIMGGIFGPLSYIAGERLGGLEFINFEASIIGLGVIWAVAMPLLLAGASRFDGLASEPPRLFLRSTPQGEG